jgi:L-arabinose isomerase
MRFLHIEREFSIHKGREETQRKCIMVDLKQIEVWFVTGSQHLYGEEALKQVDEDSQKIVEALTQSSKLAVKVAFKPGLTTPEAMGESIISLSQI